MFRKSFLYLLPTSLRLFSCVLALPGEAVEPIAPAAVEEPTPAPLEQAKITFIFDLPNTPTPAPTATPTEVVQDLVVPVQVNGFVYLQPDSQRQTLQRAFVGEAGRAVLRAKAIEVDQNTYVRSIRPSPKGDLTAVIFGTEGGDDVEIYDFASGELFSLLPFPESGVSSSVVM